MSLSAREYLHHIVPALSEQVKQMLESERI